MRNYVVFIRNGSKLELTVDVGFEVHLSLSSIHTTPNIRVNVLRDGGVVNGLDAVHVSSGDITDETMEDLQALRSLHGLLVWLFEDEKVEFTTKSIIDYTRAAAGRRGFREVLSS